MPISIAGSWPIPATAAAIGGPNVALTSGAGGGTKGSRVQIIASTPTDIFEFCVTIAPATLGVFFRVDIMTGAGGSEVVVVPNLMAVADTVAGATTTYVCRLKIPLGTRVAAQCSDNVGSGSCNVCVFAN